LTVEKHFVFFLLMNRRILFFTPEQLSTPFRKRSCLTGCPPPLSSPFSHPVFLACKKTFSFKFAVRNPIFLLFHLIHPLYFFFQIPPTPGSGSLFPFSKPSLAQNVGPGWVDSRGHLGDPSFPCIFFLFLVLESLRFWPVSPIPLVPANLRFRSVNLPCE